MSRQSVRSRGWRAGVWGCLVMLPLCFGSAWGEDSLFGDDDDAFQPKAEKKDDSLETEPAPVSALEEEPTVTPTPPATEETKSEESTTTVIEPESATTDSKPVDLKSGESDGSDGEGEMKDDEPLFSDDAGDEGKKDAASSVKPILEEESVPVEDSGDFEAPTRGLTPTAGEGNGPGADSAGNSGTGGNSDPSGAGLGGPGLEDNEPWPSRPAGEPFGGPRGSEGAERRRPAAEEGRDREGSPGRGRDVREEMRGGGVEDSPSGVGRGEESPDFGRCQFAYAYKGPWGVFHLTNRGGTAHYRLPNGGRFLSPLRIPRREDETQKVTLPLCCSKYVYFIPEAGCGDSTITAWAFSREPCGPKGFVAMKYVSGNWVLHSWCQRDVVCDNCFPPNPQGSPPSIPPNASMTNSCRDCGGNSPWMNSPGPMTACGGGFSGPWVRSPCVGGGCGMATVGFESGGFGSGGFEGDEF